uniref:Protein PTHB1 n=1 Tax=Caenorhabditis tropicalis TaxID=1561998 RepID=A0A1I7T9G3_9PELO
MSLFRLVEWVSHTIPHTSAILNASFFQDREQLVVGGEDGQIIILDPGFRDDSNHVLATYLTKYPILQMASDKFLAQMENILAVLSPTKLTYFKVTVEKEEDKHATIEEIFSHSFSTSAWNMCIIPIEDSTPQILVQSIDCKLSLYQGDQCVFSLVPLRALQPGPIGYCQTTQTLFVANNGFLAAIKFSLMSSGSQKKINYDWSFNLGDTAIHMEVTEGLKPTTIILCRRHVSAFNSSGSVVWQIRLEAVGMSMVLYRSLLINNTQFNRLIIATSDDTLLIFQDNKLVWNCSALMSPVALLVCSYNKIYENTITMMASNGKIVVGYLGTEPSLYKVPEEKVIVNYTDRIDQFKELELKIKESDAAGGLIKRKEGIQMKLSIGEIGKRTIEPNAAPNAPYCNVVVEFSELHNVSKLHINIQSEMASPSNQIVLNVGNSLTVLKSIELPFKVLFEEAQIDRNAKYKVTFDTNVGVLALNQLFSEYESDNPQAIGFCLHGTDKTVSIFAANKSNRYRIQSEHVSLLQIASAELVKRIASSAGSIEIGGTIPFGYMHELLEEINQVSGNEKDHLTENKDFQLEAKKKEDSKTIDCRTKEVRAIVSLSLNSCKTGNMGNLPALDALFDKSYRELLDSMDSYNVTNSKIETEKTSLNSLFQLAADISKLSKVETMLNGHFWANTKQSLRDRLCWACRTERGNEMKMIEKLCEHSPKELPKIKEEEEEAD